jgi:hypothetical protein
MSDAFVSVGATPTELPRASATAVTIQNQSGRHFLRLAVADAEPEITAAGPLLEPWKFGRFAALSGGDKIWGWIESGGILAGETIRVLVQQE